MARFATVTPAALVGVVTLTSAAVGCRPAPDAPLGPPDSFVLLAPAEAGGAWRRADGAHPDVAALTRVLLEPFGSELLRTVYMAKQFLAQGTVDGAPFHPGARAVGRDALAFVLEQDAPHGLGMTLAGAWLGGPVERPDAAWIGLPAGLRDDPALVQTLAGRIAGFLAWLVTSGAHREGGAPPACAATTLTEGYRMALEVIAREWRSREGAAGRLDPNAGTPAQRELFARVRENAFVLEEAAGEAGDRAGAALRPARALLEDPGVAATVLYQLAQNRKLSQSVADAAFYQPFAGQHIPPGISPAVVLGAFRNQQAKLLIPWLEAVRRGEGPCDLADLIGLYARRFPADAEEVVRVFLVTTRGATVLPGGVAFDPAAPGDALARLDRLAAEVRAGARGLRDATLEVPGRPGMGAEGQPGGGPLP